jgi:signal transduction histidine kinase
LLGGAVLVPLAAVLGWLLAGRALRPVRAVTAAAQRVSDRRLSERINMRGRRDEITELAATFDAMLARLERAFEAQRRFVANASHELRTPLAVAGTAVDVVLARPNRTTEELESMAGDVRAAVDRAEGVLDGLLTLTRSQHLDHAHDELDLAALVEDALDVHRAAIAERELQIRTQLSATTMIGDRALLGRLVDNLVDNALRHNDERRAVRITCRSEGDAGVLVVANTGPAVPSADVTSLFEPFTRLGGRARSADSGLGLGLAIVRAVAEAHRGEIAASAPPDGGLVVSVRLPRNVTVSGVSSPGG